MNDRKGYIKARTGWLRWLMRFPVIAIVSHWLFQSLFYMEWSERIYKLLLDFVITGVLWTVLHIWIDGWLSILVSFSLSHTFNFLFNGHLWGVLKYYGKVRKTHEEFSQYTNDFKKRVRYNSSIHAGYIYGSISLGKWTPASDLDVRLVREPGWLSAIRACTFALIERSRALFSRFPLDLYILDSSAALEKMSETAIPIGKE